MSKDAIRENNFTFTFEKIKDAAFTCQSVSLPSLSMGVMDVPTTQLDFQVPGSKLIYDPLAFEFIVDDDLANYKSIQEWFLEMRDPTSNNWKDLLSDCTLTILTNQKNPLSNVKFYHAFPQSLSELNFNYSTTSPQILKATISIEYMYYEIV